MQLQFERFPIEYNYLNGYENMHIKKIDLCRHTMQTGYRNMSSFLGASIYKHFELFFMVMANVDYANEELSLKKEYSALDQSEKVCVSYQIGQGLTKAVAEKYFKVPWVAHVKTMKNMGYKFTSGGKKKIVISPREKRGVEPDLIGFDKGGKAHLFESKGSSAIDMGSDTIQKAINQVSNYVSYRDSSGRKKTFTTRNACLFNFSPNFHGRIIDPPMEGENEKSNIGLLQCLYSYYYHFLYNEKREFKSIKEFGQEWSGYILSFNDVKYFWGINSLYRDFLQEQFINYDRNYIVWKNYDENMKRVRRILNFFNEQETSSYKDYIDSDIFSIGEDGYILCNMNSI